MIQWKCQIRPRSFLFGQLSVLNTTILTLKSVVSEEMSISNPRFSSLTLRQYWKCWAWWIHFLKYLRNYSCMAHMIHHQLNWVLIAFGATLPMQSSAPNCSGEHHGADREASLLVGKAAGTNCIGCNDCRKQRRWGRVDWGWRGLGI